MPDCRWSLDCKIYVCSMVFKIHFVEYSSCVPPLSRMCSIFRSLNSIELSSKLIVRSLSLQSLIFADNKFFLKEDTCNILWRQICFSPQNTLEFSIWDISRRNITICYDDSTMTLIECLYCRGSGVTWTVEKEDLFLSLSLFHGLLCIEELPWLNRCSLCLIVAS